MLQWLKKNQTKNQKPSVVTQSLTATLFYLFLFYPSLQMIAWI